MKIIRIFIFLIISVTILNCSSGRKSQPGEGVGSRTKLPEIQAEAYLFDVKLRRKGKPTSIRLDLYQTDSVVAMYGRGYFNKGAFSGRITDDSMLVYFPSTSEYLNESIEKLFLSFDCESKLIGVNLLEYFLNPPDSEHISENLRVETIEERGDVKQLSVSSKSCPWRLLLAYRKEKIGWRLDLFEFEDGRDVTLKGSRRQYKENATVPGDRFRIEIKTDALKIAL